jgi:hypothetical protein
VNDTIDVLQDDVQRAVVGLADSVEKTNTLIADVSGDLKLMAASGAKIADDAQQITEGLRTGKGSAGKLLNDDELYTRIAATAQQAQEITANTKQVVAVAKTTLEGFQSKDGPVQGMTASVKQTMDDARSAMAGFAANMEALKHNFLVRGFFKGRGYFNLADLSPAEYRKGVLTKGGDRQMARVWLRADALFEADPDHPTNERLTDAGKRGIDLAIAAYIEDVASGIVIVEGYAQQGTRAEQYLQSRARASLVRDHLIAQFQLDPEATGTMPLGAESTGSPEKAPWNGVALAVVLPKAAFGSRKSGDTTQTNTTR